MFLSCWIYAYNPIVIIAIKIYFILKLDRIMNYRLSKWILNKFASNLLLSKLFVNIYNVKHIISVVSYPSNNKTKNINEQQNRPFKHEKYVHGWVKEMLKIYISKPSLVML